MALRGLCAALFLCAAAHAAPFAIDSSRMGRRLDGWGAISGGGATSRLLFQYPEPQLSQILDFLFLPSYGASLHHLKVEIGGDGQSSEGVEPSHMHSADETPNFQRGYEFRLMVEARKRNPSILLSALAWTWPGWVGAGRTSPWTDPPLAASYLILWLRSARDVYNVSLDYIDADWNERGWSSEFVTTLRAALDASGFASVGIVCGDDAHAFSCATAVAADPALRAAVVALGVHGPSSPPDAATLATGVALWGTEVHVTDDGGSDLATMFANLYAIFNVTGGNIWNALSSYNPSLFSPDWGLFRAWQPWSSHYALLGKVWVMAHWTQATLPGWAFLEHAAGGTGTLDGGGQFTTLVDKPSGGFTLIISKPSSGTPERVAFALAGPAAALVALHAVRSRVVAGNGDSPDLTHYFVTQPDLPVTGGAFTVDVQPGDIWTLTTVATLHKGVAPFPPPAAPFPLAYNDTFDDCPVSQEAPYWTDMTGVWECISAPAPRGGVVMRQMATAKPLAWRPDEQRPFSLFAADASWRALDVSVSFTLSADNDTVLLGARANPNDCCGRVIAGEDLMPGAWLALAPGGAWTLYNAIANVSTPVGVLAHGSSPVAPIANAWHTLRLAVTALGSASASIDGASLFAGVGVQGSVPPTGFVGFGTGTWGQHVLFDDFAVTGSP